MYPAIGVIPALGKEIVEASFEYGGLEVNIPIVKAECYVAVERMLEDHQLVMEEIRGWSSQTTSRLIFLETPRKYDMFDKSRVKEMEQILYCILFCGFVLCYNFSCFL